VGELGAAFLCADRRITAEPHRDHAQYFRRWPAVLRADKKAIFTAAPKASEAGAVSRRIAGGSVSDPLPSPIVIDFARIDRHDRQLQPAVGGHLFVLQQWNSRKLDDSSQVMHQLTD